MNPKFPQPRLSEILGMMTLYLDYGHSTPIPYVSEAQIPHKGESIYCFTCMVETAVSGWSLNSRNLTMLDHCILPALALLLFAEVAYIVWRRGGDSARW